MCVGETVEGFGAPGEFDRVAFERLGEGVEKAPDGAGLEFLMAWYGLHRQLTALGVINYVVAPQRWDERGIWNVTQQPSTSTSFLGRFATMSISNPFSSAARVYICGDMDDDIYIVNIGEFMQGIDHACRGKLLQ